MRGAIEDHAARAFAIGFYGGLGEGESVATAFEQGCAAIGLEGLRDSDRPQLHVRAGVDAARMFLAADPASTEAAARGAAKRSASPSRPDVDIGILTIRNDEFHSV